MTADDIRHRLAAATPGLWEWQRTTRGVPWEEGDDDWHRLAAAGQPWGEGVIRSWSTAGSDDDGLTVSEADRDLIAHAPTDLALLLDQLDTLRNAGQALAEALDQTTALVHTPYLQRAEAIEAAALANWRAACGNTTRQEQG